MSAKFIQDMQPNTKRRTLREAVESKSGEESGTPLKSNGGNGRIPGKRREERSRKRSYFGKWFVVGIIIVFLFFVFSITFSGSKVLVFPKTVTATIDETFSAYKQASAGQLQYEIMTITKEGSKTVEATGESFVEEKASGFITIYNDFSEDDQRLVENTRFRTPSGLVYRTTEPIVVPGQKEVNGELLPGSISARVLADAPGEEYNIEGSKFDVPGFEGSPQFENFWAESETEMDGGFRGIAQVANEEDREIARKEIQEQLKQDVMNDVHSQTPEGFILIEDGVINQFEPLTNEETETGEVLVREKVTVRSIIFDEAELAKHIAKKVLEGYSDEDIRIRNIESLNISLANKDTLEEDINSEISIAFEGQPIFVWQFDSVDLSQNLQGQKKKDIDRVLISYPSIDRAEVILRPFWRRSVPEEVKDIKIETIIIVDDKQKQ